MTQAPQTPPRPTSDAPLDPEALSAIRSMIAEASAPVPPAPAKDTAPVTPARTEQDASPSMRPLRDVELPPLADPIPRKTPPVRRGLFGQARAWAKGWRPSARQIFWTGLALLIVFRPWLMAGLLFLSVILLTVVFLALGYDGFWRRVLGLMRWYASKEPERAAKLQARLDAFAMKWDAVLDRFPDGSVDGLYLPDFGEMAAADARHDAALARRLDRLAEGEGAEAHPSQEAG